MHGGLTLRFLIPALLSIFWLFGGCFLPAALLPAACNAGEIDWTAWESIPVLDRGRLMSLDTFARCVVRDICGRENPKLVPPDNIETLSPRMQEAIHRLFPKGTPRKFSAAELLYSWTVEPEVWDHIPFLQAGNQTLREKGLEVPIFATSGKRLKHVSPLDFEGAFKIVDLHDELAKKQRDAKRENRDFKMSREDEALLELISSQAPSS